MATILEQFKSIVNFSDHIDIQGTTESIKKGIDFKGPNAWILFFAIIVASVGLNVNSIPVIIGAMLISPLMGPIMGAGLAIGVNDTELLRKALKNLAVMVIISLFASTAYFIISPLALAEPTELLARTRPTIYDVFIALFGGLAGIVEGSKKDKGTVIAGVAIATALMPPLCTAGYGLANGNMSYFGGAMYLFTINSIFIALATYLMVRYMKFPHVQFADPAKQRRVRRTISFFTLILIVPSIYTGVLVIRENSFNQSAKRFIAENKTLANGYIYDYSVNHKVKPSHLEISIAGEKLSDNQREILFTNLERHGIMRSQVNLKFNSLYEEGSRETEMLKGIFERTDLEIARKDELINELRTELDSIRIREIPYEQITKEIKAQHPEITSLTIARGAEISSAPYASKDQVVAIIKWKEELSTAEISKLQEWLSVRLNVANVKIVQLK
ncbi:MAG: hypothetical protein CVU12_04380 [Bacteroidetes bacterium HGW-Bacteroidetes-7]|jgi:uncharacterized hydrophobic protein (TIGR00271 family)|nr:MAG: hypothetical protein CVU12_04380 [Bacteroidetes bacterium HGW-Bacteroidetes-7]